MKPFYLIAIITLLSGCGYDNVFVNGFESVGRTVIAAPADMAQAAWSALFERIKKGDKDIPTWVSEMPECEHCQSLNEDKKLDQEKYFFVCNHHAQMIRTETPESAAPLYEYRLTHKNGNTALTPVSYLQEEESDFFPFEELNDQEDVNTRAKRLGLDLSLSEVDDDFFTLPEFSEAPTEDEQELKPIKKARVKFLHTKFREWFGIGK